MPLRIINRSATRICLTTTEIATAAAMSYVKSGICDDLSTCAPFGNTSNIAAIHGEHIDGEWQLQPQDDVNITEVINGAMVHSIWRMPEGALAAAGIPYTRDGRRFEWSSSALEKGYSLVASFDPPTELNATSLYEAIMECKLCPLALKVDARMYDGSSGRSSMFQYYEPPTCRLHPRNGTAEGVRWSQSWKWPRRCHQRHPRMPLWAQQGRCNCCR